MAAAFRWLRNVLLDVRRGVGDESVHELFQAQADLAHPPASLEQSAEFSALHRSVCTCVQATILDVSRGSLDFKLVATIFDDLDKEVSGALDREIARDRRDEKVSWNNCVKEAMSKGVGWAHRWSNRLTSWQPHQVWKHKLSRWSGRPVDLLEAEQERLSTLWQAAPQEPPCLESDVR